MNYSDYELYHQGILGMHWGIRRYQNPDGTLTAEGKQRYKTDKKFASKIDKDAKIRNINQKQAGSYTYGSQQRADVNNKHHDILSSAARTYGDETTYAMLMGKNGTKGEYDVGRTAANAALNYLSKINHERIAQDYALKEYNQDGSKKVRDGSAAQRKLQAERKRKQAVSQLGFTVAKAAANILLTDLSRRANRTGARQPYDINGKWAKSGRERSYQYRLG